MFTNWRKLWVLGVVSLLVVVYLGWTNWFRFKSPPIQEKEENLSSWRADFSETDLDLLARVVRAEAQGEPYDGQIAVAAVILNRVKHAEFPNTIPGVIFEPLAFSVVANGEVNRPANASAIEAAHAALNGFDPSEGALYFYNPQKSTSRWIQGRETIKTIGKHIFAS